MQLEADEMTAIINRAKRAHGHFGKVIAMMEEGAECEDVLTQLAAVIKAINRTGTPWWRPGCSSASPRVAEWTASTRSGWRSSSLVSPETRRRGPPRAEPCHHRDMTATPEVGADASSTDDLLRAAERHASTRVPVTSRDETVSELLARLRGNAYDSASVTAVCEGERLVGMATIERLLGAPPGARVASVMDDDPPTVSPTTHQELVAWAAFQHGEPGIAVVDAGGRFRGLISAQTLLGVLLVEHDEDMARLGGYLASTSVALSSSTERVGRRLLHRLPWLLVGLAGALAAAVVVSAFGRQLEERVLIAYFVPGVVYIAAAVGMQTETLVIRGLSLGVGLDRVAIRELVTGAVLGLTLAGLAFPLVWAGWGDLRVAVAVSAAMFLGSSIATSVAMLLPWTLSRLGKDPAFGSGPIATVVQDLLTVTLYFLAALIIVS